MSRSGTLIGIVLAAGKSSRMGVPKALLPCPPDGATFVARVVRTLHAGGLRIIAVVGRDTDMALQAEVDAIEAAAFLANLTPELGQLSSLLVGVEHAERAGADGVLVLPVDTPLVLASTVAAIVAAFDAGMSPIVRATHHGRHGHPVIFGAAVFQDLRAADPSVGARALLRDASRVLNVDVDDPGVLRDVDVPEDYRRLFDR